MGISAGCEKNGQANTGQDDCLPMTAGEEKQEQGNKPAEDKD